MSLSELKPSSTRSPTPGSWCCAAASRRTRSGTRPTWRGATRTSRPRRPTRSGGRDGRRAGLPGLPRRAGPRGRRAGRAVGVHAPPLSRRRRSCARPSGVSWLYGKPIRWRPAPSTSTTWDVVVELGGLRRDPERAPDRRELRAAAEQELHAAGHVLLVDEELGARRRVVARVDRDAEHRDVVAEVVERAADGLDGRRAGVVAVRVDERVDDRAARSEAGETRSPSWEVSVKSGARAPGGRSEPAQPVAAAGFREPRSASGRRAARWPRRRRASSGRARSGSPIGG